MPLSQTDLESIKSQIVTLAKSHGFQDAKVSDTDTGEYFKRFKQWVEQKQHGDMVFLENNQSLRQSPQLLHPDTLRVISLRYNYLPEKAGFAATLGNPQAANISRYALGRDYHKLLRKKLDKMCREFKDSLSQQATLDYRVFVDSAPVLETAFAEKSGLGWKGKHTLLINKDAGSWFFLGEIFINLPLPLDHPVESLCGSCTACISLCPTGAIIEEGKVDATRCISYLTIENKSEIPVELRQKMGNHIYGCDDCQLACPWNRYAQITDDSNFYARDLLKNKSLLDLWSTTEAEFLEGFSGNPIRRIGFQNWLRNLAVAIGNAEYSEKAVQALKAKKTQANAMVVEHIDWAIKQLESRRKQQLLPDKKRQKLIHCVQSMLPRDA